MIIRKNRLVRISKRVLKITLHIAIDYQMFTNLKKDIQKGVPL